MTGRSLRGAEIAAAAPGTGPNAADNSRNLQKVAPSCGPALLTTLDQGTKPRWLGNLAGKGDLGLTFCAKLGFPFLLLLRKGCEQCGTRSSLLHMCDFSNPTFHSLFCLTVRVHFVFHSCGTETKEAAASIEVFAKMEFLFANSAPFPSTPPFGCQSSS